MSISASASIVDDEPILAEKPPVPFQCSLCGECCSSLNIPIEKDKSEALLAKPWVQKRFKALKTGFIPYTESHHVVPLTDTGVCVFLRSDGACEIQAKEGLALKPTDCIKFPFAALQRDEASLPTLITDASAMCKTITNDLLTQFTDIVPRSPEEQPAPHAQEFPGQIPVHRFRTLSPEGYLKYRQKITQWFSPPEQSVWVAMTAVYDELYSDSFSLKPLQRNWSVPSTVSGFLERILAAFWLRRPYGILSQWGVLIEGTYWDPKIFGPVQLSLAGHQAILWPTAPNAAENMLLKGFLHNLLRRRVVLGFGHSLSSLFTASLLAWILIRWYARALTLVAGKPQVDLEAVQLAIRLAERYYTGHQPRFLEQLRRFPGQRFFQWMVLSLCPLP